MLTPTHIRYNPFLSLTERSYRYEQARTIRTAPAWADLDGNDIPVRQYLICFEDGGLWGTMWNPGRFAASDKARVAQLFAERSKVAITELKVLRKEDQSCTHQVK